MATKYYRTEFKIVVLSEDEPVDGCSLGALHYAITEGDCSGGITATKVKELTPKQAARALIAQASDPEFFGLNEDGTPADEEYTGPQKDR